ncbi:hypothetical protein PC118_g4374 [Phytophthora cactorum]|uniref:Uncharacterized protein n=1 Tax=Phytophthora cactorum TaxID=29920 RepID=A0A8T1E8F9_9STRA|nr:hypothetical protein PC114_g6480 [Phytophthora cactorum]KAG2933782.1 hypothetical protein PC115_g5378 [Phytophthora cactorum]KAG2948522.1 hypothetical protein PC117_g5982 [Phytophthora cactorum]KAG2992798.1 hypothetical protein PC118_g4374 [Phytophthora cactorum]KAG3095442.1 hypothetical protein PC122_g5315 [Phytophthora cactorum]
MKITVKIFKWTQLLTITTDRGGPRVRLLHMLTPPSRRAKMLARQAQDPRVSVSTLEDYEERLNKFKRIRLMKFAIDSKPLCSSCTPTPTRTAP